MRRMAISFLLLALLVQGLLGPAAVPLAQGAGPEELPSPQQDGDMPGWPVPDKPIPHHEPGHLSRAGSYTTRVVRENEVGVQELAEISGVDAMVADGLDPLVGNYTLLNADKIMMSWNQNDQQSVQTFESWVSPISGSEHVLDNYRSMDIAAGDLNNDGQDEQIAAWRDPVDGHIRMSIGEMPGSLGRTTSAPAAVAGGASPDGWVLQFDGVDDYVDAGSGIDLADQSFTVAFWAKRDTIDENGFVLGQGTSEQDHGLHLGFRESNAFTCAFWSDDLNTPAYVETDWHHWACTYKADNGLRTIYRDGVEVAQDTAIAHYQGSGRLYIGDIGNLAWSMDTGFNGLIDGVGIWNVARTQDQIQAELIRSAPEPDEVGLVAYWPFDEGAGATAEDITGDHDGTLMPDEVDGPRWNDAEHAPLGEVHLLVRGYDEALWHCIYDVESEACLRWSNAAGGTLLSAPAVASLGDGQFDVFVIGTDNDVYRRHWEGGWSGDWQMVGDWPDTAPSWIGPTPELPAPAVVARDGGFDLFRVGPDNTLRWFNGTTWWSLGGMLASGPGAVSLGADHMQVFARGVDEALWYLTYSSGNWGAWQRLALEGMDEGVTIASAPTAVSTGSGQVEVYARGSDNQLWQVTYNGTSWGTWASLGGPLASGVAMAAGNIFAQAEDGSLRSSYGGGWTSLGGLPPCCAVHDTGLVGALKDVHPYEDYSVDVETGYFLGDGRSQIALAYEEPSGPVKVALFQTDGGFEVHLVDEVAITDHPVDWFKIASGDFFGIDEDGDGIDEDGDGIEEVALAYVDAQSYGVDIVQLSREGSEVTIQGSPEEDPTRCWNDDNPMKFAGTLEVVSGDFDADGQDEIAMTVLFNCHDYDTFETCHTYRYHSRTRIFDVTDSGGPMPYLTPHYIEYEWGAEVRRNAGEWSVGLALAAGDVDGDGREELIRTWPDEFGGDTWFGCGLWEWYPRNDRFKRKLQVYKLHEVVWPDDAWKIDISPFDEFDQDEELRDLGETQNSFLDRLTASDVDRDVRAEIVWHIGTNADRLLLMYQYLSSGTPSVGGGSERLSLASYPNLVTGDFTGESLRVGPPNYRRQYSVGRITAIINAPPKHADVLNGVEYNINAADDETLAKLTKKEGTLTDVSLTTKRDWGLSTTYAATVGDPDGTHTSDSLTNSYGENFSKTSGNVTTFEIDQTHVASVDDGLFYIRTDYDVWEYPVLVDPTGTAVDYVTVAWPASEPTLRVDGGNTCDAWYRPRHQIGNVWSYPSSSDELVDRDQTGDGDLATGSEYTVSDDPSSFTVNWGTDKVTKRTSGFDLGFSNEFEWQIGGDELSFEIAGVGLSTRLPSFKFSSKADYNYSQLAEWEVKTTDSTEVYGYLNGVPGSGTAGYNYAVRPYLYWAEDGYLMLDYTTRPEGTFWTRYDKPDPAFILPWTDGRCNAAENPHTEAFTRDILIDPPVASAGDPVTLTATVRNFSLQPNSKAFSVAFYLGDPDADGAQIGDPQTIGASELGPRDVETVTVHWIAEGSGDQRIYVVIDPTNQLAEVHDETDPYANNNKGYGLLSLGAIDFVDMGEAAEKVYYPITYGLSSTMEASLYVPVGNLAENTRFDFQDADLPVSGIAGKAFELLAYRGEENWDAPEENYLFRPDFGYPPAVMTLSYADSDVAGMDEGDLTLWRLGNHGWEVATCPSYEAHRFPGDNLLAVPLCEASVFALSDERPLTQLEIFLPLVLKNAS